MMSCELRTFYTPENKDFLKILPEMLRETEEIMDEIIDSAKIFHELKKEFQKACDRLRRINICAHDEKMTYCPSVYLREMGPDKFVVVDFQSSLSKDSRIFLSLKYGGKTKVAMKTINNSNTTVTLKIPEQELRMPISVSIDLVTLYQEDHPWCIIKNCLKIHKGSKSGNKVRKRDTKLLQTKYLELEEMMKAQDFNYEKIKAIKLSIANKLI